ncbi:zinc-dependent alcohol dehydrogenase [Streptomyces bohaiensis]|uniref:2-deoxy-scyllo-inosamine dehydrogenase n=1 Tax=Streptomyces bohaiensis TaxID=1431344 RepID=A0ABX1C8V2_9ACTN|nr:zinc-binding dehydrogenase [Streptomyces bohaiensis]NJQ15518.1 alcohol dehydrogenase catalytic domain-containing protein [Streptomyces bohaiensis]
MHAEQRYLRVSGPRRLEEHAGEEQPPAADGVVVDIIYSGVCGTDVHGWTDGHMLPPAVFGHEWTGRVSAVGAEVSGIDVGRRVVGGVGPACGTCRPCVAGHTRHCGTVFAEANGVDDAAPAHGAFASRLRVSARRAIPVPDELSDVEAALVEPATVTFHAVRRTAMELGSLVVVQGAGPIGLLTAQHARNAGAARVIVSEPSAARRGTAEKLGFRDVVAPGALADALAQASDGLGADVLFECSGVASLLQPSAELVRRGGTLALLGYPLEESTVRYGDWQSRELTVIGSLAYTHEDFTRTMRAIAERRIDVATLHTGTVGLSHLGDLLSELDSGDSPHTKVLVDPRR